MAPRFANRVLVLGAGSVSQCVLPLLIEHLVDAKQITIADMRDNKGRVADAIKAGATYIQDQLTKRIWINFYLNTYPRVIFFLI